MSDTQQIAREKALYCYHSAVDQGDFAQVADILAQAESDPVLEQMILELNEVLTMAENPATNFNFASGEEGKQPSQSSNRILNWLNLHPNFTRRRSIIGGGIFLSVLIFFVAVSNLFLRRSPETVIETIIETVVEAPVPTAVAYLIDAPSASIASYSLLSRSDANSVDTAINQPTPASLLMMPTTTPAAIVQAEVQPRFIVRNGAVQASVEDTLAVKQTIEDRVAEMANDGAFVISSNESGRRNDLPTINMAIRVPVTHFDEMMDWLAAQVTEGTTATRSETADDVTAEYVDLAARIQSLQAARARLLELMQNAETTEELLLAEQQLTQRETEIEGLQGRLQYLSQSAQLSRINITLTPYILSQPPDLSWRPAETTRRAYDTLLDSGRNFLDFLILFVIAALPWLVVAILFLALIYRFVWRPLRSRLQ